MPTLEEIIRRFALSPLSGEGGLFRRTYASADVLSAKSYGERYAENTKKVVDFLSNHPQVERVNHPSLPDHPQHALYQKYFPNGGASIFTFDIKGGQAEAWKFIDWIYWVS